MRIMPRVCRGTGWWVGVCVWAVVCACAGQSRANVSYAEGADLGNTSPTSLGALGFGANTVQGVINPNGGAFNQPIQGDTADEFSIVVPANMRVSSLTVQIFAYSSTVAQPARFRCLIAGAPVNTHMVTGFGVSPNLLTAPAGLLAGTYIFRMESLLVPSGPGSSATVGFIINMQATDCSAPQPTATGEECAIRITVPAGGPSVKLYRSPDGSFGTLLTTLAAGQTEYLDPLPPGATYAYRTQLEPAHNPCGGTTSYISNPVTATAQFPVPPPPVSNPSDDGCSGLTWSSANGAEEVTLTLHNAETAAQIFTVTIPATQIPYRFPASFNPFPLLGPQRRAFWGIQSRNVCGGFVSAATTTFTSDFTLVGSMTTSALNLVNGPCSVLVYPIMDPGVTSFVVVRVPFGGSGIVLFENPTLPYFEDASAVPGQVYNYFLQVTGCNVLNSATHQLTVQRTPQGGPRPPVRIAEAQTATLAAGWGGGGPPAGSTFIASWRRGGLSPADPASQPVVDGGGGGRISGATTPTLTIQRIGPDDTDTYWCTITAPCGPIVTSTNLFLAEGCGADYNRSGGSTIDDLFLFLNAWFSGCP